jgi:hypothetical protein
LIDVDDVESDDEEQEDEDDDDDEEPDDDEDEEFDQEASFNDASMAWLSKGLAKRLLLRLRLLSDVRRVTGIEQLRAHAAAHVQREAMPAWWLPAEHDVALLRAVTLHGLTSDAWQSLLANSSSPFYTDDAERRAVLDAFLIDAPPLLQRLGYVVRTMLRDGGVLKV